MELKLTHESICINEIVFDGVLEQAIELDYLLPDYCQSIFKILKCKIVPKITSQRIMNGKLLIDGVAYIKIIYVGEESYQIRSITQKQVFSKSMELKENYENGFVTAYCKCDYVNCRVVNQHRLDIRGAVSIKAAVSAPKKLDIISKACGMGVQINNRKIVALSEKLYAQKEFSIKEEFELSYGKSAIVEMLDYQANAILTDYKIIQNKVIVKGELMLHTLYSSGEDQKPEIMDYTVPMSQIIDTVGINEDYQCMLTFDVTGIELSLKTDGDGECKCFDAEFMVHASLEANRNDETQLINDIYSTGYEVQTNVSKVKIEQLVCVVNETVACKTCLKIPQSEINCVYDISCDFTNESAKLSNGCMELCGNMNVSILALDCENMPVMIDKVTPAEIKLECRCCDEDVMFTPIVQIASVSYNMVSGDEIEVRAELRVCGNLYQYCFYDVVNAINIDENCKRERTDDAVLRLYFANCGEKVWDIAKKFNTSVQAIILENNLESDTLIEKGMLLIPISGI